MDAATNASAPWRAPEQPPEYLRVDGVTWYVWRGPCGLSYARRCRCSPIMIARAPTRQELPAAIEKVLASREELREAADEMLEEEEARRREEGTSNLLRLATLS